MANNYKNRELHIKLVFVVAAVILLGQAAVLQLFSREYQNKAEATTIDRVTVYPSRGAIYDRYGNLLVYNNPIYDLMATFNQVDTTQMHIEKFCDILGISRQNFHERLNQDWTSNRYSRSVPFVFMSKLSAETYARLQESLFEFPGFFVQTRNVRGYPHHSAAHVLGYIQEVDDEQIAKNPAIYGPGDYIGASGLEAAYESQLRGTKGVRYVLKDNLGREVGDYRNNGITDTLPISGRDLLTTLDLELQQYGEKLMQNKIGGIVALDIETGGILSMVSTPTYDPNQLTINRNRGEDYKKLLKDPNKIFFNRATMAEYPPGSLFKPFVALVALQEEATTVDRTITCNYGYYYNGIVRPACHGHPTCRNVSMAIQHSCNAYFAQLFRDIVDRKTHYKEPEEGLNVFEKYMRLFGLGETLDIDFPQEKPGNIPTTVYYDKLYGKNRWFSPYIMSVGIGQGETLMTNMQMANLAAAIANKGSYYTPHLVQYFREGQDTLNAIGTFRELNYTGIDTVHFQPVIDGMEMVVRAGTARSAYTPDITICGKTGTAENPHGEDHSIFFAFAPKENPEIAIAVYVEHGKWGSTYAAPIASLMIEKYLRRSIAANRKYLEQRMLDANLIDLP